MKRSESNTFWIIIGAILAILGLVIVLAFFTSKSSPASKQVTETTQSETSSLKGEACESIVLGRKCFKKNCPNNYVEVTGLNETCKGTLNSGEWWVCCEKVE
ncbi:MAG: hypothetical protein QXS41_03905 [Candidatus Woesearchaeota archaeon]